MPSSSDTPVVDFGAHLYPESVLPDYEDDPDSAVYDLIGPVFTDPDVALDRFNGGGVDRAVLSQPYYFGHADADLTAEANDALLEIVDDYDEYYGLAAVPTAAGGDAAAAEFERALDAGYHGGAIESMTGDIELTDVEMEPVFEVAEEYDAPLMIHPKLDDSLQIDAEIDPDNRPVLTDRYRLNAIFGREAAMCESVCKVIHEGVLDRFTDLNLVFHHLGGNLPAMLGRIHLHLDEGRWPNQDAMKSFPEFRAQLEERVYLDTSAFFGYHAPVEVALKELPSSQLLFATDAPAEPRSAEEFDRLVTTVRDVSSETDSARVLGGNALDLLANVD